MGGRQATGASAPTATTAPVITSTTTLSPLTCRSHGSPGATQVHAEGRWGCGVSVTALATNTRCAATVVATAGRSGRSKSNCGRSRPSFRSQRSTPGSNPTAARVDCGSSVRRRGGTTWALVLPFDKDPATRRVRSRRPWPQRLWTQLRAAVVGDKAEACRAFQRGSFLPAS